MLDREAAISNVVCCLHLMPSIVDLADGDGPPSTENALVVSLRFVWKENKVFKDQNKKISHFCLALFFFI